MSGQNEILSKAEDIADKVNILYNLHHDEC